MANGPVYKPAKFPSLELPCKKLLFLLRGTIVNGLKLDYTTLWYIDVNNRKKYYNFIAAILMPATVLDGHPNVLPDSIPS